MKVPDLVLRRIKKRLWATADERNWPTLSDPQKSAIYQEWVKAEDVGGVLSRYLDSSDVRVYIKDTIMKPYGREHTKELVPILTLLGLPGDAVAAESYIKPHGRRLSDGKVICWGPSSNWKAVLFAVFERAYMAKQATPFAAVILSPTGKYKQPKQREMVEEASRALGIMNLVWYDA